jgi:hypothetical protein
MPAASDLATLQDVKDWINQTSSTDDKMLARLITSLSGAMYSYLSRQIVIPRQVTERYDGLGNDRLLLRNYPVLSVSNLTISGSIIPAGTYPSSSSPGWPPSGYNFTPWDGLVPGKPQILDTFGYCFIVGRQNISVTYMAGYQVSDESGTVPATTPYTIAVQAPLGPWASDQGAAYADGTALTAVTASPSMGEYIPPVPGSENEDTASSYTFSSSDAGAGVLISYGFVPSAINDACIEWVAERYRYRGRIGQKAQTVAGQQTASYDLSGVPNFVKTALDPYRCVVPFLNWY